MKKLFILIIVLFSLVVYGARDSQYSLNGKIVGVVYGLDVVNGDGFLAIRDKPRGLEIGRLYNDDRVIILKKVGSWYKIKTLLGNKIGWSYGKWIRVIGESSTNTKSNVITINSKNGIKIALDKIDKSYSNMVVSRDIGFFKFISTKCYECSDFGPGNESLYLVFHNYMEMPHRKALFKVGDFGSIKYIKKLSKTKFKIKGQMFESGSYTKAGSVIIILDAKDVIDKEINSKDLDMQGYIDSFIRLKVK